MILFTKSEQYKLGFTKKVGFILRCTIPGQSQELFPHMDYGETQFLGKENPVANMVHLLVRSRLSMCHTWYTPVVPASGDRGRMTVRLRPAWAA